MFELYNVESLIIIFLMVIFLFGFYILKVRGLKLKLMVVGGMQLRIFYYKNYVVLFKEVNVVIEEMSFNVFVFLEINYI